MSDDQQNDLQTSPTAQTGQTEFERLTNELEECKKQSEEYLNGWRRAKADYVNFKNDQEKRAKELAQFAIMASLLSYIPIVDNLRTAFAHLPSELEQSEWVKGIRQIYNQMKDMLKTMGVEEFSGLVGKSFDPAEHQAIGQEQRDDFADDVISQEVAAGYTHHGKVLVPAKVIVNKKPQSQNMQLEI